MSKLISHFRWKEYFPAAALSLAACFMLFFYAPMELYFNNVNEFWYDFYAAAPPMLVVMVMFLALSLLVMALLLIFSPKLYRLAVGAYAVAFLATYVQGNYLVSWLPGLNGNTFDWASVSYQRYISLGLWAVAALMVGLTLYFFRWKSFRQVVGWVANGFTLMLVISLIIVCLLNDGLKRCPEYVLTSKNEMVMSEQKNYVIFMLDATGGRAVSQLLKEKPEYKEVFQDFTYYDNVTGGYSVTSRAVPFILSGKWYLSEEKFVDYELRSFKDSPLLSKLEQEGYAIAMYDHDVPQDMDFLGRLENAEILKTRFVSNYRFCVNQLRLMALRYGPFDLKPIAYGNLAERMGSMRVEEDDPGMSRIVVFWGSNTQFETILDEQPVTTRQEPAFRFIHLEGAHVGFDTRLENGRIVRDSSTYEQEVEVSLFLAKRYIEALKAADVYDNTCIVVMADHGNAGIEESQELALERIDPMLFVKGFGETHEEMQVSNAPISHEDMCEALMRLADGAQSDEIFDWREGDKRERRFITCFEIMREYMQTGQAGDMDTLIYSREYEWK